MKRIKAACITPTLCFFNHDKETTEYAKRAIVQEYEKYKSQLERSGTKYKILSETTNVNVNLNFKFGEQMAETIEDGV